MNRPLHGCRVLDLGIITAGAATSALLADLGAEVIKVEAPDYRDPFRGWAGGGTQDGADNAFFRFTNRGKTGISLDLKHEAGRAAFLRLVQRSDVVLENFRRGVLARLRLDYPVLRATNPAIILAAISSQGETGPDANYVSFGTTLEAVGGLAWASGYADGPPVVSGREVNYPDQVVAMFAAGMILTALLDRRRRGEGVHLDISQRELTSFLIGEMLLGAEPVARRGNADPLLALQDCFCAADGTWLAISVDAARVAAFDALIGAMTNSTGAERHRRTARWVGARAATVGLRALAAIGVAAAPVLDGAGVLAERGRQWDMALASLPDGAPVKGFPFQLDRTPLAVTRVAPAIGADTAEVLHRIGGYTSDEIARLAAQHAVEVAG